MVVINIIKILYQYEDFEMCIIKTSNYTCENYIMEIHLTVRKTKNFMLVNYTISESSSMSFCTLSTEIL